MAFNALRQQVDGFDGILRNHRYLIHDRNPLFTMAMIDMLNPYGVSSVMLPPRSPYLNTYAERLVRSIKSVCVERIIPIGERHLSRTIDTYIELYNRDQSHQRSGNKFLLPSLSPTSMDSDIVCDKQLSGLIRS